MMTPYLEHIGVDKLPWGHWNDFQNHIKFKEFIAKEEKYVTPEDWYKVSSSIIRKYGGQSLLNTKYNGQTLTFLQKMCPSYEWYPWLFHTPLKGFWDIEEIINGKPTKKYVRMYLKWIHTKKRWTTQEDYYKLTRDMLLNENGSGLLKQHNNSLTSILNDNLPPPTGDDEWYPWRVGGAVPNGFWDDNQNLIKFRDYIAKKEEYKSEDDWYRITSSIIRDHGGSGLIVSKYNGQTIKFMEAMFPNYNWLPWKFIVHLQNFWEMVEDVNEKPTRKYVLKYLKWIHNKMGWTSDADYYKLTQNILLDNYGGGLLNNYSHSVLRLLSDNIDPPSEDEEWYPWLLGGSAPNNFWDEYSNRKKYANWLYKRLKFTRLEDWYNVTQSTFRENYGSGLILSKRYNSSHVMFLQEVYKDEFIFYPWLFKNTTRGFWKSMKNRKEWMKYFSEKTGYDTPDKLYSVSREEIKMMGGGSLLSHYYEQNYAKLLIELNPHVSFDPTRFIIHKTEAKFERFLISKKIKYEKQSPVICGKKNGVFRVDFILPLHNIAIEIDGPQHFRQICNWLPSDIQRNRDVYKMKLMAEKGYRCIRILQEEILNNDDTWLDCYIVPLFEKKDMMEPEYICINTDKYGDIYHTHRTLYQITTSMSDLDLYVSDVEEETDEENETSM